jgi:hypothetical protein
VPLIVDPSELKVPVRLKDWVPATAVRLTVWPLSVPLMGAEPLLQGPRLGVDTEYSAAPLTEPFF